MRENPSLKHYLVTLVQLRQWNPSQMDEKKNIGAILSPLSKAVALPCQLQEVQVTFEESILFVSFQFLEDKCIFVWIAIDRTEHATLEYLSIE